MNKLLFSIFILSFSLTGFAKAPKWISDISKGCKKKTELCAVGTGVSRNKAEQNARVSLAKIFQNKVSSTFKSKLSSSGSSSYEEMSEEIMESTQMALEGLEIKKTHEDKLNFYALAVVNKRKTSKGFKREIDKLDEKMQVYAEDSSASSAVKLEKTYIKRESLSQSFEFLTGRPIPSPISFDQVFNNKKEIVGNTIVHVYLDEDEPKSIEAMTVKLLSEAGYKTTSGRVRNKHSTHIVTGTVTADKQYMKVAGFEKYDITVKIAAKNKARIETGHLTYTTSETGRNFSQAYNKGLVSIKKYLKTNLTMLNIE
jgi:hypothetical protein